MLSRLRRYGRVTEDWLRYHPLVRSLLSRLSLWRGRLASSQSPAGLVRSLLKLCAAARLAPNNWQIYAAQKVLLARLAQLDPERIDWPALIPDIDDPRIVN